MSIVITFAITFGNFVNTQAQQTSPRMLIPLYMYPSSVEVWANVVYANVYENIDVVINPDNGVGTSRSAAFTNGVNQLRAGHVGVYGYVITDYGTRLSTTVKAEIDNWQAWYNVDGIFLDEASNSTSNLPYYSDLWIYITAKGMKVILNPGANTNEAYASVSDSIVIYESIASKNLSVSVWIANYPASKFAALQYGASAEQMRNFVALAKTNNVGYIYVTNDIAPNPWDELPPYLAEEAIFLKGGLTLSGNAGVAGAILSYTNGTAKTVTNDASGNYSITVPIGWSGTVTPSHPCYTFSPVNRTYGNITGDQIGQSYTANLIPASICVLSILRASGNPTGATSVNFTVTFSQTATGVDTSDFALTVMGVIGTSITDVSGSGTTYTVTANTGIGNGTIRLDVVDDDSIKDAVNNQLGGVGVGNGNFASGEIYTVTKTPTFGDVPFSHPYSSSIEILYANGYTAGCSSTPLNFCPKVVMNRAQAAVFMMRGNFGGGYLPPSVPSHFFTDDWSNTTWAETWAEAMFTNNLTAGCSASPLKFCPQDQLTNAQAAVFGLRLKYGLAYAPPLPSGTVFADMTDPGFWGLSWAEQAYADGLIPACGTSGGKPKFCPDVLVSRGFGASVIVKAKNLTMP